MTAKTTWNTALFSSRELFLLTPDSVTHACSSCSKHLVWKRVLFSLSLINPMTIWGLYFCIPMYISLMCKSLFCLFELVMIHNKLAAKCNWLPKSKIVNNSTPSPLNIKYNSSLVLYSYWFPLFKVYTYIFQQQLSGFFTLWGLIFYTS